MKEQITHIKKILRKATASELRGKAVYMNKEVNTSNPSRLFRSLASNVKKLGYEIDEDIEKDIDREDLRGTGYLNISLSGMKVVSKKKRKDRRLLVGLATTAFGVLLFFLVPPLGLLAIGFGEMLFIFWIEGWLRRPNGKKKPAQEVNKIWVLLESKAKQTELTLQDDLQTNGPMERVSEFIVHVAGESNSESDALQAEIKILVDKLEFLAEGNRNYVEDA